MYGYIYIYTYGHLPPKPLFHHFNAYAAKMSARKDHQCKNLAFETNKNNILRLFGEGLLEKNKKQKIKTIF